MNRPDDRKTPPSDQAAAKPAATTAYEPPTLTELGSVRELTGSVPDEDGQDAMNMGSVL